MIYIYSEHELPRELDLDNMINKNFDDISFHRCFLTNLDMHNSSFCNCDFRNAETKGSIFDNCNLEGARLIMVPSMWASFKKSNLHKALLLHSRFGFVDFSGTDFTGATIKDSVFFRSDLRNAILNCEISEDCDFTGAKYNKETQWPDGFNPQEHGAIFEE